MGLLTQATDLPLLVVGFETTPGRCTGHRLGLAVAF